MNIYIIITIAVIAILAIGGLLAYKVIVKRTISDANKNLGKSEETRVVVEETKNSLKIHIKDIETITEENKKTVRTGKEIVKENEEILASSKDTISKNTETIKKIKSEFDRKRAALKAKRDNL